MSELLLPEKIKKHIAEMKYEQNQIGCSGASVYRFYSETEAVYLKLGTISGGLETEYRNLLWMQDKLPVPKLIEWVSEEDTDYLLTADIGGKMLCDDIYRNNPTLAVSLLAEGINRLRSTDISNCPIWNDLSRKLTEAADNIKLNRIDMDDWEPSREYDDLLLKQIGIPINSEKLNYYILLDELF